MTSKTPILRIATAILAASCIAGSLGASEAKARYKVAEVKDGATISGKMVFSGKPPRILLKVDKDVPTCCPGCTEKDSPRLLVSPKGGVRYGVVFLVGVTEGKDFSKEATQPVLDQEKCVFEPHVQVTKRGSRLRIKNSDPILHNVHGFIKETDIFNVATPTKDVEIQKPLRTAGLARIQCDAGHIWMSAYIFVVEHPYYAVTDAEGRWELKDVPPGEYTLRAWHEGWEIKDVEEENEKIIKYHFTGDIVLDQKVALKAGEKREVNFELTDKGKLTVKK